MTEPDLDFVQGQINGLIHALRVVIDETPRPQSVRGRLREFHVELHQASRFHLLPKRHQDGVSDVLGALGA